MTTMNARETLNHLYGLMMEMNFHRSDEDVLEDLSKTPNARVEKHLDRIKLISANLKADLVRQKYSSALEQIKKLRDKGFDELQKLLAPKEQLQLQKLFRKFEEITEEDETAILEDQELLQLMAVLKDKLNNDE